MFKIKLNSLKSLIEKKTEGNNKKNIENLVVFLILLVITIIAINSIWGSDNSSKEEETSNSYKELVDRENNNITSTISGNDEYNLENRLKNILSNISGVRKSGSFNYIFSEQVKVFHYTMKNLIREIQKKQIQVEGKEIFQKQIQKRK